MGEVNKILYIVVVGDDEEEDTSKRREKGIERRNESFRYTRPVLQSTLQLMGCKARHAFKISKRVFKFMTSVNARDSASRVGMFVSDMSNAGLRVHDSLPVSHQVSPEEVPVVVDQESSRDSIELSSELYRRRTTLFVNRAKFLDVVCDALAEYKYVGPNQRSDLILACRIRERKESVTILLCGTSGCGKSTLSSLLGSRLGITTVISTDSIRHMMRSFVDEKQNQLLWASTYHAGECLDHVAVAEATARRKATKKAGISHSFSTEKLSGDVLNERSDGQKLEAATNYTELITPKKMAIEGFKAQSEMVIESLDRLITAWEERKESVIVEGVHLSLNFVMGLMKKHPSVIPFMIYITNEDKHLERFAVRAKYMTLDPAKNKYVKYIRNIRSIQEYLCNRADKHLVPKINNTNVDKSVATIHATVFSCLRRREGGEQLYDSSTNCVSAIYEEYRNQCAADSLSSKGMFQLIQRKGSSRHLMALVNNDGSVAKAWPVGSTDRDSWMGTPMYGPLQISKAEPVNLQFGHFGISAWPSDYGGTSYASSFDESRTEWTGSEIGSRCYSSCCSSPRMSDGPSKKLKEELSVSGSDEEIDDAPELGSDEDLSDDGKRAHEELEGSVDEESTKSDEEYDDLAMQDEQENSYYSDDDKEFRESLMPSADRCFSEFVDNKVNGEAYPPTLELFLRTQSKPLQEHNGSNLSICVDRGEKRLPHPGNARMRKMLPHRPDHQYAG